MTAVIHPFAEELVYFVLLATPIISTMIAGVASTVGVTGYLVYIDFMNYMGHCNFEMVPNWLFRIFPPLKYLMYTPS
jgi:aldehyde decarbonylase